MQIVKSWVLSFNVNGANYNFTVFAETREEAIMKLAKDLAVVIGEIQEVVVQ